MLRVLGVQKLQELREWTLTAERALLYTMGFNFAILHPQVHILNAVTHYKLNRFSHLVPAQPGIDVRLILHAIKRLSSPGLRVLG